MHVRLFNYRAENQALTCHVRIKYREEISSIDLRRPEARPRYENKALKYSVFVVKWRLK